MEPLELLEALVAVVATLGQLAATVAGPYGDVLPTGSPRSLHMALGTFINHLRDTLCHSGVTYLGQALADLGATPGSTWANVRDAARAWHSSVAALGDRWDQLSKEATKLCDTCGDAASTEATTKATAIAQAGDLQDKTAHWGTARGDMVATARQPLVTLAKDEVTLAKDASLAAHKAQMKEAFDEWKLAAEAWEDAVLATSQAAAATRREQQAEKALGPLKSLVAACDRAKAFPRELLRRLGDIEATLKVTEEASANVPEALMATVAEAEQLWEASARLATRHLHGICTLISGPGGCVVAEQCQKAMEDIPKLLGRQ